MMLNNQSERIPWLREDGFSRQAGMSQWKRFSDSLLNYGAKRNFVTAEHTGVSRLSPWLNKGIISEEEICQAVLGKHSFGRVEKFLQEVYWRRYWRGYLSHRPQIWMNYRERVCELSEHEQYQLAVEKIVQGECSVEIMGYWAQELIRTGYMHNHARMWFAAWWVHVERLPWELGADFFLKYLIDGDPGVNTLSWRWVAGIHTAGKNYLTRRSNLEKFVSPELLTRYKKGLELLEEPIAAYVTDTVADLTPRVIPSISKTLEKLSENNSQLADIDTLVVFAEDLDLEISIKKLNKLGAKITQVYLLFDSLIEAEYSTQKVQWNKRAREAMAHNISSDTNRMTIEISDLNDSNTLDYIIETKKYFIIQQPEVGHYTTHFEQIREKYTNALLYYDQQKERLNSYAKAGFFTYWKKLKKDLFQGTWNIRN